MSKSINRNLKFKTEDKNKNLLKAILPIKTTSATSEYCFLNLRN